MSTRNLNKYFIYRLIQVLLWVGVLYSIILSITNYNAFLPKKIIDIKLSKILCINGKSYSFEEANIISTTETLLSDDNIKASNICNTERQIEKEGIITVEDYLKQTNNFKKEIKMTITGSYKHAIGIAILSLIILLAMLFVLREALLYLFFSKNFFQPIKEELS